MSRTVLCPLHPPGRHQPPVTASPQQPGQQGTGSVPSLPPWLSASVRIVTF